MNFCQRILHKIFKSESAKRAIVMRFLFFILLFCNAEIQCDLMSSEAEKNCKLKGQDCYTVYIPLRFLKAGSFERMSLTGHSHPLVTHGNRVSRAPSHDILLAFLDLHCIS